ncbi:hypothetical protein ZIOFF_055674 [Zingiber officinale]|uniref:Uncharacterized protein n=1 Tax=Zingiber officinale TaxID=94328 RepID=A0A8J5FG43_ZINOF|nr:hypothetical protein ZIOFF_055674 [Zingiber officinale]
MYIVGYKPYDTKKESTNMKIESHWGGGNTHHFVADDQSYPQYKEIYEQLEELAIGAGEQGYELSIGWVLHCIEEELKENSLGYNSEKLALALGLF